MPSGRKDISKDGINTRFPNNDPTKGGRKPSLKKQLEKVALSDGWLTFDIKDVQILENSIKVKVPKEEAMALKMFQIAMGKNPNAAMNAIKLYLETFDGKANQNIRIKSEYDELTDDQINERLDKLKNFPDKEDE